jgi:hypothetical protein
MQTAYDELIRTHALAAGCDPVLVQALVCQESQGDPWAHRVEQSYLANRVVLREAATWSRRWHGTPTVLTESTDRASSWGLGQLLGQTAREHGFAERYLTALADPALNLVWVCRLLAGWTPRATRVEHLIAMWNGGPGVAYPQLPPAVATYVAKVQAFMTETPYHEGTA